MGWGPEAPAADLPAWARWEPLPSGPPLRTKLRSLTCPRSDVARLPWRPPEGWTAMADDPLSFPAVAGHPGAAVTVHYLTSLDTRALGDRDLADIQDIRAERRVSRRAEVVFAFSDRVAEALPPRAVVVPIACHVPDRGLEVVAEPIAALLADWRWPPNARALRDLLGLWPEVRDVVPGARLLLGGRGLDRHRVASSGGVEAVGPVREAVEILGRAAVLAFPCPGTSGPKMKVLEALAYGLPVVTTRPGVEGLAVREGEGAVVAPLGSFAGALVRVLTDPEIRARLGRSGREAVARAHGPVPAARSRLALLRNAAG